MTPSLPPRPLRTLRVALVAAVVVAGLPSLATAAERTEIHFAPQENLERIDAELLGRAGRSIDFAGYMLTDPVVIDALLAAQARGVAVRLVLDPSQRHDLARLAPLLERARLKPAGAKMHLKSYAVDGAILRSGAANFTVGALRKQDNDLLILDDAGLAGAFLGHFERLWQAGVPIR